MKLNELGMKKEKKRSSSQKGDPLHIFLPLIVKYINCAVEILWLVSNDLCAWQLRDGLEFLFSPDIMLRG